MKRPTTYLVSALPDKPPPGVAYKTYIKHRDFLLDSGAGSHQISIRDLTREERKKLFLLSEPFETQTANGIVTIKHGINLWVPELSKELVFDVTSAESPVMISIGKL